MTPLAEKEERRFVSDFCAEKEKGDRRKGVAMKDSRSAGRQPEKLQRSMSEKALAQPDNAQAMPSFSLSWNILAAAFNLTPDALLISDAAGTVFLMNALAETLFGYSRDELVGQSVELLLPEGLRSAHILHRAHYMQEACPRSMDLNFDLIARRKDGSEFCHFFDILGHTQLW